MDIIATGQYADSSNSPLAVLRATVVLSSEEKNRNAKWGDSHALVHPFTPKIPLCPDDRPCAVES